VCCDEDIKLAVLDGISDCCGTFGLFSKDVCKELDATLWTPETCGATGLKIWRGSTIVGGLLEVEVSSWLLLRFRPTASSLTMILGFVVGLTVLLFEAMSSEDFRSKVRSDFRVGNPISHLR
jgi:hypothetical protein